MPEHFHIILIPALPDWPIPRVLIAVKQPPAQTVVRRWRSLRAPILPVITDRRGAVSFWQRGGGFDRNVRDWDELCREIRYVHHNPVERGLVADPLEWAWSSARWYAGEQEGQIPIDLPWGRPPGDVKW